MKKNEGRRTGGVKVLKRKLRSVRRHCRTVRRRVNESKTETNNSKEHPKRREMATPDDDDEPHSIKVLNFSVIDYRTVHTSDMSSLWRRNKTAFRRRLCKCTKDTKRGNPQSNAASLVFFQMAATCSFIFATSSLLLRPSWYGICASSLETFLASFLWNRKGQGMGSVLSFHWRTTRQSEILF
jgi:hypothetical protein